jgi:hypothetical protein
LLLIFYPNGHRLLVRLSLQFICNGISGERSKVEVGSLLTRLGLRVF